MVKDVVCGMFVDEKRATASPSTQGRPMTSVPSAARGFR